MFLKQSTATQSRMVGPFVDDTDFKTLETGLTIANTDVKLSKNGAAGVNKNSGGGTHRNNGMYSLTFDATDTNTVGELAVSISVAGALVVIARYTVLEEVIYNALFETAANAFDSGGRVDIGSLIGSAQSATDLKDFADAGYDPATNKVEGVKLVDTTTTNTDMRGTDSASTHSAADVWAAVTRTLTAGTNLNDISVADILTTQMTESYAANGTAPTLAQGIFAIHQMIMQFGIAGTSYTVRQLDDATPAFVVTLDNATTPTDAKRV